MDTDNQNKGIRVINEEYDRVLSNPENIIVSDSLQDLIDLNLPTSSDNPTGSPLTDSFMITALNADGLPVTVRGEMASFTSKAESYSVSIETSNAKQEFLACLTAPRSAEKLTLLLAGTYNTEISASDVGWSVEKIAPYSYRLNIDFRSDNVIF